MATPTFVSAGSLAQSTAGISVAWGSGHAADVVGASLPPSAAGTTKLRGQ